jgi:hypothetical protein
MLLGKDVEGENRASRFHWLPAKLDYMSAG